MLFYLRDDSIVRCDCLEFEMTNECPKCKNKGLLWIDGGRAGIYDGVVAIQCQQCGHEFPRSDHEWAKDMFRRYQELKKIRVHRGVEGTNQA